MIAKGQAKPLDSARAGDLKREAGLFIDFERRDVPGRFGVRVHREAPAFMAWDWNRKPWSFLERVDARSVCFEFTTNRGFCSAENFTLYPAYTVDPEHPALVEVGHVWMFVQRAPLRVFK